MLGSAVWWSPPEVVAALLTAGPGSGSLLAAQAGWARAAAAAADAATGVRAVMGGLPWTGPSASAAVAAGARYAAMLDHHATTAATAARAAAAAATAHSTAATAVVPAPVAATTIQTARALAAINWLGVYTATIAELEATYAAMWAHNTTVGQTYESESATATAQLAADQTPAPNAPDPTSLLQTLGVLPLNEPLNGLAELVAMPAETIGAVTDFSFLTAFIEHAATLQQIVTKAAAPTVTVQPTTIAAPPAAAPPMQVNVARGAGQIIGRLTAPSSWTATPAAQPATARPAVAAVPRGVISAAPIPLPIANAASLTRTEQQQRQPRYGHVPTAVPKHPAGG